MTLIDHLFVFILVAVHPVAGFLSYRKLLKQAAAGEVINRVKLFETAILQQWVLFGIAIALWAGSKRPWDVLGFNLSVDPLWFTAAAVLGIAVVVVLYLQYRQVATASQEDLNRYRQSVGSLDLIVPRNNNELGRFNALSVTAGIVEETLWRGFLIWYLALFMPVWAAAIVSSIGFGIAHAYQGPANLPKIVAIGGVFAALFILSGSLWLPMLLHAIVDIVQGRVGYELYRRTDNDPPSANDTNGEPGLTEPA